MISHDKYNTGDIFEFGGFKGSSPHSISTVTSVDKPKRKVSREMGWVGGGVF